jgi:hypothetical protein
MPPKVYVVLLAVLGVLALVGGIAEHDGKESLSSLIAFGMAAFAYLVYVRRWKR